VINTSAPPQLRELYEHYREVWVEHKDDPDRHNGHVAVPKMGTSKHIFVGETDSEAEAIARKSHEEWQGHIGYLGRKFAAAGNAPPPARPAADGGQRAANRGTDRGFDAQVKGGFAIAGSPSTVADALIDQIQTSTVNYILFIPSFGKMRPEDAEHSLELICSQVMPKVRSALASKAGAPS
jgi:alkanesulfonate monooxygenase SsuD/methylene tetrahydromethanopterin reductase-like flavin-dependent oxidoreductase (luciferase family)